MNKKHRRLHFVRIPALALAHSRAFPYNRI
jgi:hypothetical protein